MNPEMAGFRRLCARGDPDGQQGNPVVATGSYAYYSEL